MFPEIRQLTRLFLLNRLVCLNKSNPTLPCVGVFKFAWRLRLSVSATCVSVLGVKETRMDV
jgi:hypothetical protein